MADAFHNLPALLLSDSLRLPLLRSSLADYQQEYGAKETTSADGLLYDYLAMLDEVEKLQGV